MTNQSFFQIINLRSEYEMLSSRKGFPEWAKDGTMSNLQSFVRTHTRSNTQKRAGEIALKILELSK